MESRRHSGLGRWQQEIARRNLLCTVAGDHIAFSIWSLWSVMALFMPASVYGFSAGDKLLLGAVATLAGGCVRIPYTLGIATFGGHDAPYWVCAVYLVLLAIVGIAAAVFMDNLDHGIEVNHMRSILFERDTYVISLLYICTFGSWIGFAFGQVLQVNFLANGETAKHASLHAAQIAFVGPLLGSLARIYGGKLADRMGGSRVTLGVLGGMILAAGLLASISSFDDRSAATRSITMIAYVFGFVVLFILSGMGNGSVFKLIPSVFEARSRSLAVSEAQRRHWSRAMSGSLIGFCAAIGALGGVGINLALRESYLSSGTETSAYWLFLGSYVVAAILTWTTYVRRPVSARPAGAPNSEATAALERV
jgi:NNP family nitrate/nitrite transporter-like MFS transporter